MAAKRARSTGGSVTGGTGDVKPQILTLTSREMVNSAYAVETFALPVARFGSTVKTKATVFEILSVDWYLSMGVQLDGTHTNWAFLSTTTARVQDEGAVLADLAVDAANPRTIALAVQTYLSNAPAEGALSSIMPISIDLTDSNGNGVLVATDFIALVSGNFDNGVGLSSFSTAKVKYRLSNVGVAEYVGIVQSQQG